METWEGKNFSITDPKGVSTVIYQVTETEKEFREGSPRYTVERLDHTSEIRGENIKRTFFVDRPLPEGNSLVILSFGNDKVVVNTGIMEENRLRISRKPMPVKFDTIYSEKGENVYKEFNYTPNLQRPISIIDPETTEEVKPVVYLDEETNEIKGKCKLKPYKSYFAFEIRPDD